MTSFYLISVLITKVHYIFVYSQVPVLAPVLLYIIIMTIKTFHKLVKLKLVLSLYIYYDREFYNTLLYN